MERLRVIRLLSVAAAAAVGGCAVYATPEVGVITPAPAVVVSPPPVIVHPWGPYWGPGYYRGTPRYWNGPRYDGGGRGYPHAPVPAPRPSFPSPR
jgi:hypothetical protein